MSLGSGHGSVEHKLRCLVQKVFCETSSIGRTMSVFNRVRCCCVDTGTEMALADITGIKAQDVMPQWMTKEMEIETDAEGSLVMESGPSMCPGA